MKILIKGPLLSMSGYGNHARQVFELVKASKPSAEIFCDVLPWGNSTWILSQEYCSDGIFSDIIEKTMLSHKINECQFNEVYHVGMPEEWIPFENTKNIGITAGIESDYCKEEWINNLNSMDLVIVPSSFSKKSFLNTSKAVNLKIKTDIQIIPEWFYVEFLEKHDKKYNLLKNVKTEQNILIIGQVTSSNPELDRKNISRTLREAISYITKIDEKIGIVLKITTSGSNQEAKNKAKEMISQETKNLDVPVYLLFGNLTPYEIKSLYTDEKITCLLTGTRGECFGLTILEAAINKLPIVATDWSSYLEFISYYFPLEYKLKKVNSNSSINFFSNESKWAEFESSSLEKQLNKIFIEKSVDCESLLRQSEFLINNYSKDSIIKQYKKILIG